MKTAYKIIIGIGSIFIALLILLVVIGIIIDHEEIQKKDIQKMSDKQIEQFDISSNENNMTKDAINLYYDRDIKITNEKLNKSSKSSNNDKSYDLNNDSSPSKSSSEDKQIKQEITHAMKQSIKDNHDFFDQIYQDMNVKVSHENHQTIVDVEFSNDLDAKITDTANLDDTDMSVYAGELLKSFHNTDTPTHFDRIKITLTTHSWKKEGDTYEATTSAKEKDLHPFYKDVDLKVNKVN